MRGRRCALRRKTGAPFRPVQFSLVGCRKGAVAFEFILVAPVLFLILFAILYFGVALNNYLILTAAAEQGAQILALGRGTTTPYTTATTAVDGAAANSNDGKYHPDRRDRRFDMQQRQRLHHSAHRRRRRLGRPHLSMSAHVHGL